MRKKIVLLLSLIILISNYSIQSINENRELLWKKYLEQGTSKLPIEIREQMNSLLTNYFNNQLSDEARLNGDFKFFGNEREYYFTDTTDFGSNKDLSCYSNVNVTGDFEYKAVCVGLDDCKDGNNWYKYANLEVEFIATIKFDPGTGANRRQVISDPHERDKETKYLGTELKFTDPVNANYVCNKENPIISKIAFTIHPPEKYYDYDYYDNDDAVDGDWDVDYCQWSGREQNYKFYVAKSPKPRINEYVYKQVDPDENNAEIHNRRFFNFDIISDYNVKIFYMKFYKYNEVSGKYEDDSIKNPDIIRKVEPNGGGINYIRINQIDEYGVIRFNPEDKSMEGKYMMVLGVVDKFNKIYVFEPEYFIMDFTAPVVSGGILTEDKYLVGDNPVIADLTNLNIIEKYTDYSEGIGDYLYVIEKSTGIPIKVTESDKLSFVDNKILAKVENVPIVIDKVVIYDKADNQSNPIIEDKQYIWDKSLPEVKVNKSIDPNGFITSRMNLSFDIIENSNVSIGSVSVKCNGIESNSFTHYPSLMNDLLIVNLKSFEGQEGTLNVFIDVVDDAGNHNAGTQNFTFKFDDKKPVVSATLNGNVLVSFYTGVLSETGNLGFNVSDLNFDKIFLDFKSNSALRQDVMLTSTNATYIIEKKSDVGVENLELNVSIYDKAGNITKIDYIKLDVITDKTPPVIRATQEYGDLWTYFIEVFDEEKDSIIGRVYSKEIEYTDINTLKLSDFGELPPTGTGWSVLGGGVKYFSKEVDILPKHSICIVAEDAWGNITDKDEEVVIIANKLQTYTEIDATSDLDDPLINWELSGEVVISTDIEIPTGKTLTIKAYNTGNTVLSFKQSPVNKYKIINKGGTLKIDRGGNDIVFKGLGEAENDYIWFGIVNETGTLIIEGDNRIYFNDAVAGITYENPNTDMSLSNIEFKECKIGIHYIDGSSTFNKLNIDNMALIDTIYGVKFDISGIINKAQYMSKYPYLTDSNIMVDNIIRGHIYCPVNGLVDFQNFNNAPGATNVVINGDPKYNNTLTADYIYKDDNAEDTAGTRFRWYTSTNKQGPYSAVNGAVNKNWMVELSEVGKWVTVRVMPRDMNGGFGASASSEPVYIINQSPNITNLGITGIPIFGSELSAEYNYSDPEGHAEGLTLYQWYSSDTDDGTYIEIPGAINKTWTISSYDYASKWIKVKVIPVDFKGAVGNEYRSMTYQLGSLDGPYAKDVFITGIRIEPGETLEGHYTFGDPNSYVEGVSILNWEISDTENGYYTSLSITGGTFPIEAQHMNKWLRFVVTPYNAIGVKGTIAKSNAIKVTDINVDIYDTGVNNDNTSDASDMGSLSYKGTKLRTFTGFVNFREGDRDFFVFTALDPVKGSKNSSAKNFHIRIKFKKNPSDAYRIKIWDGKSGEESWSDADPNTTKKPGDTTYYQFDWGLRFVLPPEMEIDPTGKHPNPYNPDSDYPTIYIIEISRVEAVKGIDLMYEIEISNGVYPDFKPEWEK